MAAPVALVAALELEAEEIAAGLSRSQTSTPGIAIWEGSLERRPVVLGVGGVGKVAAAIATQFLCDVFRPQYLISFGLAGALDGATPPGQVIVAAGAVQHDFDARPLARQPGEIPGLGLSTFEADPQLVQRLQDAAGENARSGIVLTGDQIVTAQKKRDALRSQFPEARCLDMETASVAQVAYQNSIPWSGLRITSDAADESFNVDEVIGFGVTKAAALFEEIVRAAVKDL